MAGEPILIVDDTPVNLKLTRILLVNEGYKVLTAASAEEALELLKSYRPASVLADIQLPGMDGLQFTRRIKQDEATRDIVVVALTAFAMKGDEQKAIDAGCDGYIAKPINTRELGERIRQYLERSRKFGLPSILRAFRRPLRARLSRRRKSMPSGAAFSPKARSDRSNSCSIWTVRSTPRKPRRAVHRGLAPAACWDTPPSAAWRVKWKPAFSKNRSTIRSFANRSPTW